MLKLIQALVLVFLILVSVMSCSTQGQLDYIAVDGSRKVACETQYSGAPKVDKFAVEFILSYCARKAVEQGNTVVDESLLVLDLTIAEHPLNKRWTFDYATEQYKQGKLTDKEYGYIIAFIDLGLNSE